MSSWSQAKIWISGKNLRIFKNRFQKQKEDLQNFPVLVPSKKLTNNADHIQKAFPDKFSPIPPNQMACFGDRRSFGDNGVVDRKFPKSSSPLRPITKQKALKFDNNNLGDFITIKRKTKKRSVPMKTIPQTTANQNPEKRDEPQPLVFGVNSKSSNVNPFDVEEIVAKNTGDIERLALKEIRQSTQVRQSSQKSPIRCPVVVSNVPVSTTSPNSIPNPDDHKCCSPVCLMKNASRYTSNLFSDTVRPEIGKIISENYLTYKSKYLIQDVQFLLSIISQKPLAEFQTAGIRSAVPQPDVFHAIASIVLLHLVPVFRHFLNKCTISFLLFNFKNCINANSTTQILITGILTRFYRHPYVILFFQIVSLP